MGLRRVVAFGADDADDPWPVASVLAEHHALAERCAASNLVGFRLGVGTVLGQHDGLLVASAAEARANGWAVHTHLAVVKEEVVEARLRWGETTVGRLGSAGPLDVPLLAAHCIRVRPDEIVTLAGSGATRGPEPGSQGECPVPALRQAGIPVGVGTDWAASNDSQNILEAVKAAALLQKVARLDPWALTAGDVLAMATLEGPGPWGWTAWSGPWSRASGLTWSGCGATGPAWPTSNDPRQQVVYCCSPADVADVWVDGVRRVAEGRLVDHDLAALVEASRPWPPT